MGSNNPEIKRAEIIQPEGITLRCDGTEAVISPDGAMVRSFRVAGIDVLLPDQMVEGKRRGGIPLLFPNAGPLDSELAVAQGLGVLPRHGFARDKRWELVVKTEKGVVLGLWTDEQTRTIFPYNFGLGYGIKIDTGVLSLDLSIFNGSVGEIMPIALGWHPYFYLPINQRPRVITNINGFNPQDYDWETPLIFPGQEQVEIEVPEVGKTVMTFSDNLRALVVWADPRAEALCLEPWVGPVDALLELGQRLDISPGKGEDFKIELRFIRAGG